MTNKPQTYCSRCLEPCEPVDKDISGWERISSAHSEWRRDSRIVSDCCGADVFDRREMAAELMFRRKKRIRQREAITNELKAVLLDIGSYRTLKDMAREVAG